MKNNIFRLIKRLKASKYHIFGFIGWRNWEVIGRIHFIIINSPVTRETTSMLLKNVLAVFPSLVLPDPWVGWSTTMDSSSWRAVWINCFRVSKIGLSSLLTWSLIDLRYYMKLLIFAKSTFFKLNHRHHC